MRIDPHLKSEILDEFQEMAKADYPLSQLSWLKTGGAAAILFTPRTLSDLTKFLSEYHGACPWHIMGVGSNTIFRDGGFDGVVIKLGREFMNISHDRDGVRAGAAALDSRVAIYAAQNGINLNFLRTIPGNIGGAVAMNAGCYGEEIRDHLVSVTILSHKGELQRHEARDLRFHYRKTELPAHSLIVEAQFSGAAGEPEILKAEMEKALQAREATQPIHDRTCGSTFRNPAGFSSSGIAGEDHSLKSWKLIDEAGLRGARLGGAEMNAMHPNFLTNRDHATSFELEALGEQVRQSVWEHSGQNLQWEIQRIGEFLPNQQPEWLASESKGSI